jgi:hypothetical protein
MSVVQVTTATASLPSTDSNCCICFDPVLPTHCAITTCGHLFCHECADEWFHNHSSCPFCRTGVEIRDLRRHVTKGDTLSVQKIDIIQAKQTFRGISNIVPAEYLNTDEYYIVIPHNSTNIMYYGKLRDVDNTSITLANTRVLDRLGWYHYYTSPEIIRIARHPDTIVMRVVQIY